jgi:hypothetical protein
MLRRHSFRARAISTAVFLVIFLQTGWLGALPQQPRASATPQPQAASPVTNEEVSATREQLFKLLRLSPTLTSVVARDPSLLANQDYVSHNNPELAQFLQQHSEIIRNPEFYLFASGWGGRNREQRLERVVWPDLTGQAYAIDKTSDYLAFLVFLCFLAAALWLLRVILENRRWGRIVKLQSEVHTKLLDRFAGSQELLTYMNTDAGKRFLESAPISAGFGAEPQAKMSMMRILTPLQLGIVITLLGSGSLLLRNNAQLEARSQFFLVFGTLGLMLGIGFIISAGISYVLARHMGLLAPSSAAIEKTTGLAAKEQL